MPLSAILLSAMRYVPRFHALRPLSKARVGAVLLQARAAAYCTLCLGGCVRPQIPPSMGELPLHM